MEILKNVGRGVEVFRFREDRSNTLRLSVLMNCLNLMPNLTEITGWAEGGKFDDPSSILNLPKLRKVKTSCLLASKLHTLETPSLEEFQFPFFDFQNYSYLNIAEIFKRQSKSLKKISLDPAYCHEDLAAFRQLDLKFLKFKEYFGNYRNSDFWQVENGKKSIFFYLKKINFNFNFFFKF